MSYFLKQPVLGFKIHNLYRSDSVKEKDSKPEEKDGKTVDDEEEIVFTFATRFGDDEDEEENHKNGIDLNVMKSLIG